LRPRATIPLLASAVLAVCAVGARDARAFCRTTTCPLPANFSPSIDSCYPPDFAAQCATLNPPAKVLPLWWRNACVSYDVQQDASVGIPYNTAASIIDGAFAKWTGTMCTTPVAGLVSISAKNLGPVACTEVNYNSDGPNQHVIVFRDDSWPYSDVNSTLGLTTMTFDRDTGEIFDADTEINGTRHPSIGGMYDFESIVTHEMGHFLGMAHSGDSSATMYATYAPFSTTMRTLAPDDEKGICSIYLADETRAVDPSVIPSGSLPADPCDATPRHGFTSQCHPSTQHACALGWAEPPDRPWSGLVYAGSTAAMLGLARRRRARRGRDLRPSR
jgi:hypothetical protein